MERIGHRIKRFRRAQGLSQVELARRTGLHNRKISFCEKGQRALTQDELAGLAKALNTTLAKLTNGTDWQTPANPVDYGRVFRGRRGYVHDLEREPSERFFTLRRDHSQLATWLDRKIAAQPYAELARAAETMVPVRSSREAAWCCTCSPTEACPKSFHPKDAAFSPGR